MSFNKIQPEQIQMPTFFSDSGDLNISQVSDTGVLINVSRKLTGDFSFTGQLLTNNSEVFGMPNNIDGNKFDITGGNLMFAGTSTEIGLDSYNRDNLALYSTNGDISGIRNVIVRGTNATFNTGSKDNVLLAGRGVTFSKEATGSVAIKDNVSTTAMTVTNDNTLNIQFNSGTYFKGGNVYVGNSKFLRFPTLNGSLGNATIDFDSGSAFTLTSNSSNASMVFKTSSAERMRLDKDGNLGVGSTNPSAYGKFLKQVLLSPFGRDMDLKLEQQQHQQQEL